MGNTRKFSEENIMALALAARMASSIPDKEMKENLYRLLARAFDIRDTEGEIDLGSISEKISVKNIEYSRVDEKYFHDIVSALFREVPVSIAYYSPHTNKKSVRTVCPLHLIQYMGSWHIIAFCSKRKDLRTFALSRIRAVDPTSEEIHLPEGLPSIKEYTRKNFGIIQGGETRQVRLKFSPDVSEWMQETIWHPFQKISFESDGSLLMEFPVADFREIRRRILSHGAAVKVLAPKELAEDIRQEIEKMGKVY
jgi:predicted DNA-binding transcriptional regulator YafY